MHLTSSSIINSLRMELLLRSSTECSSNITAAGEGAGIINRDHLPSRDMVLALLPRIGNRVSLLSSSLTWAFSALVPSLLPTHPSVPIGTIMGEDTVRSLLPPRHIPIGQLLM
jgi:hypothetical protein